MRKDAEAHAADDKRKVELIAARNEADQVIYQIEKVLKEHEAKLGASEKTAIQSAIERNQASRERRRRAGDPPSRQRPASGRLGVGPARPRRGGADRRRPAMASRGAGPKGGGKDDVIDAEFEGEEVRAGRLHCPRGRSTL